MYRPHSSDPSLSSTNERIQGGYSSVPPQRYTDEELGIPQLSFYNHREMMIEIEKEKRRFQELNNMRRVDNGFIGFTTPSPVSPFVPPQDDGMSTEERLKRHFEKKREMEMAAMRRRYGV